MMGDDNGVAIDKTVNAAKPFGFFLLFTKVSTVFTKSNEAVLNFRKLARTFLVIFSKLKNCLVRGMRGIVVLSATEDICFCEI